MQSRLPSHSILSLPLLRASISEPNVSSVASAVVRFAGFQPYDGNFDPDELAEARQWHRSFRLGSLPQGMTTFARSGGPGGQHVNKTESKATTTWSIAELSGAVPKLVRARLQFSRFYTRRNDSISFQAQTQRSRTANAEENRQKLFEELQKLYREAVPGESNPGKKQKYEALEKNFHHRRIQAKKQQSQKKIYRRGGSSID